MGRSWEIQWPRDGKIRSQKGNECRSRARTGRQTQPQPEAWASSNINHSWVPIENATAEWNLKRGRHYGKGFLHLTAAKFPKVCVYIYIYKCIHVYTSWGRITLWCKREATAFSVCIHRRYIYIWANDSYDNITTCCHSPELSEWTSQRRKTLPRQTAAWNCRFEKFRNDQHLFLLWG